MPIQNSEAPDARPKKRISRASRGTCPPSQTALAAPSATTACEHDVLVLLRTAGRHGVRCAAEPGGDRRLGVRAGGHACRGQRWQEAVQQRALLPGESSYF